MELLRQTKTYRLLIGNVFDGISNGLFMMALPWVMLTQFDSDNSGVVVAIVATICTASSLFLTPFFATLIDRYSRKNIMVAGQAIQFSAASILVLVTFVQVPSLYLLAAVQVIFWLVNDLSWFASNALVQENFNKKEYPSISSYQEIIMQSVTLVSGGLGVMLLEFWSMKEFALFASGASFLGMTAYLTMPYYRKVRNSKSVNFIRQMVQSRSIFAANPKFYLFIVLSCLSYPVLTFLGKLVPVYLAEQGAQGHWFAMWSSSYGIGALICGFIVTILIKRLQLEKLMSYSMVVLAIILFAIALFSSPLSLILLTIVFGFFNSLNRISRTNKMNLEVPMEHRGRVDGGIQIFSSLTQSLSYLLIAWLAANQNSELGFVIAGGVLLFSALLMLFMKPWSEDQYVVFPST